MSEKQYSFRDEVITDLKRLKKYGELSSDFIRGYLLGAEKMSKISIPPIWYDEIIIEVQ